MKSLQRAAVLLLGLALIGGCASMSSEPGRSSAGAGSNPPTTGPNAYPYYPNY
jgi:hypothetical protein